MNKILKVNCPQCDTEFNYYQSEFRPFCCEKCKMIDLGHWFEESYRVPVKQTVTDLDLNLDLNENEIESDDESEY